MLGIAKNAREEKIKARKKKDARGTAHHAEMEKLYRQHVLKEQAQPVMQIQGLKKKGQPTAH